MFLMPRVLLGPWRQVCLGIQCAESLECGRSRKKKFDNNRADNAKTEQLDQWLGDGLWDRDF